MNDFDYDVRQKKIVARGAAHRKNGSKSKRCSLPSDNLTEAQKRKLNGPCATVKLDQPMDWVAFKSLPEGLRREYLERLMDDYRAGQKMLGAMFGVSTWSVSQEMKRLGVKAFPAHGCSENKGRGHEIKMSKWEAFCNGVVGGGNNVKSGPDDQIEARDDEVEMVLEKREPTEEPVEKCEYEVAQDEIPEVAEAADALEALEALNQSFEESEEDSDSSEECDEDSTEEEELVRTNLKYMNLRYEDQSDLIREQLNELLKLFSGAQVQLNVSINVMGGDAE